MSLNPKLKPGDRVVCYYMEGETINVPIGTTGTVKKIVSVPFGLGIQYNVLWDNGRQLDLIPETDAWDFESDNVLNENYNVSEITKRERKKLLNEVDNLSKYFQNDVLYSNMEVSDWDDIKNFLEDLKQSGITNMYGAAPYIYAPWEWIQDQYKWLNLSEEQEDAIQRMETSHEIARNTLIRVTLKSLGNDVANLRKINDKIRKLATKIIIELFENW